MSDSCPDAKTLPWPALNGAVLTLGGPKFQCPNLAVTGTIQIGAPTPSVTGNLVSSYLSLDAPLPTVLNVSLSLQNTGSVTKKASVEGWVYGFLQTADRPVEECPYGLRGAHIEYPTPDGLPLQPGESKPFSFGANCQKQQIERFGNELQITYMVNIRYHQGDAWPSDPNRIGIYFTFKALYVPINAPTTTTTTRPTTTTTTSTTTTTTQPPSIGLSPLTLDFGEVVDPPAPKSLTLTNTGGGTLVWQATASPTAWLSVAPGNGSLGSRQSAALSVSVNDGALPAGPNNGTVTITSAGASNSPQQVTAMAAKAVRKLKIDVLPEFFAAGPDVGVDLSVRKGDGALDTSYTGGVQVRLASGSTPKIGLLKSKDAQGREISGSALTLAMVQGKLARPLFLQTPYEQLRSDSRIKPDTVLRGVAIIEAEAAEMSVTRQEIKINSPLDLSINRIEVQQGVKQQAMDPWIRRRNMLVRLFVGANRAEFDKYRDIEGIRAKLKVTDQKGVEVIGSPFTVDKGEIDRSNNLPYSYFVLTPNAGASRDGSESLNFVFEEPFEEQRNLEAKLDDTIPDRNPDNNSARYGPMNLSLSRPATIVYARMRILAGSSTGFPQRDGIELEKEFLKAAWPVSDSALRLIEQPDETRTKNPFNGDPGSQFLSLGLFLSSFQGVRYVYFVDRDYFSRIYGSPFVHGIANPYLKFAIVNSDRCADDDQKCGTLAHEVGHTFGLGDTYLNLDNSGNDDGTASPSSNNPRNSNSPLDGNLVEPGSFSWFRHEFATEQNRYFDFMGNNGPAWIDLKTRQYLASKLSFPPGSSQAGWQEQAGEAPFVIVQGQVNRDGTGSLGNCYALNLSNPENPAGGGNYAIETLNGNGLVLNSLSFAVDFRLPHTAQQFDRYDFTLALPFSNAARQIRLRLGSAILASRAVSAHAPTARFLSGLGGPVLTGTQQISWAGSDADGETLTYTLFYSPDGQLRMPLISETTATSFAWNTGDYASGSSPRLTLVATDGVHATLIDSAPFTLPNRPPRITILSPRKQLQFAPGEAVTLEASFYDPEDDLRLNPRLEWTSNIQGSLEIGKKVVVQLVSGTHHVTVSGADSQGLRGEASIDILVSPNVTTTTSTTSTARTSTTTSTSTTYAGSTITMPTTSTTHGSTSTSSSTTSTLGSIADEPATSQTLSIDPAQGCPGFYIGDVSLAPGAAAGMWGIEIKLTAGERLLQGGLNLGGGFQENGGINGWGAFNIVNPAGEAQEVNVAVEAQPLETPGYLPALFGLSVRLVQRVGQNDVPIGTPVTGKPPLTFQRVVNPGFYILEVRSLPGSPRGTFQVAATTRFPDRIGGGFQGGVVVGGFLARDSAGKSLHGFAAFCISESQAVSFRTYGRPSYAGVGAGNLELTLKDRDSRVFWQSSGYATTTIVPTTTSSTRTVTTTSTSTTRASTSTSTSKALTSTSTSTSLPSLDCRVFFEDFSTPTRVTWSFDTPDLWRFIDGRLRVDPTGETTSATANFRASSTFTLDFEVEPVALADPGGHYGIYLFNSLGTVFLVDNRAVAGVAAVVFNTGDAYLMTWDALGKRWHYSTPLSNSSRVFELGMTWRTNGVTLRLNRQETPLKLSGLSLAPVLLDRLSLMAGGRGTQALFDDLCAGPLPGATTQMGFFQQPPQR